VFRIGANLGELQRGLTLLVALTGVENGIVRWAGGAASRPAAWAAADDVVLEGAQPVECVRAAAQGDLELSKLIVRISVRSRNQKDCPGGRNAGFVFKATHVRTGDAWCIMYFITYIDRVNIGTAGPAENSKRNWVSATRSLVWWFFGPSPIPYLAVPG